MFVMQTGEGFCLTAACSIVAGPAGLRWSLSAGGICSVQAGDNIQQLHLQPMLA